MRTANFGNGPFSEEQGEYLKVLMLTTSFPRFQGDSAGVFIQSLCAQLSKRGHHVTALAPHTADSKRCEDWDGIKVCRFPYFYPFRYQGLCYGSGILSNLKSSTLAKIQLPLFLLAQTLNAFTVKKRTEFDLVHAHWSFPQGLAGLMLKGFSGIPCITTLHGSDMHGLSHPLLRVLNGKIIAHSDGCTANSGGTAAVAKKISGRDDIHVIPMGVDCRLFARSPDVDLLKEHRTIGDRIILFAGRFVDQKGIEYLVMSMPRILERHPSAKLALIGSGPVKDKLAFLSRQLGIRDKVIFVNRVSQWQLARYYSCADVVVLPSITTDTGEKEGLGLVLLEAMACGTPVIGTDHGGIRDIIKEEETGLLVKERDPEDLALKISRILAEEALRARLIERGMAFVNANFSWDILADKFLSLYQEVVDRSENRTQRRGFASLRRTGRARDDRRAW